MAQLKKEGRFLPIDRVRGVITQALEDYPFTHVTSYVNSMAGDDDIVDGELVFLRQLYLSSGVLVEIVYTPFTKSVHIYHDADLIWDGLVDAIPDDNELLDLIRADVDWAYE